MYQYEHVRRRSKPRNNMDNQWKRHMTIEETTRLRLVGGVLKHGMLVHSQPQRSSAWRARVKTSTCIAVPKGSVPSSSHLHP